MFAGMKILIGIDPDLEASGFAVITEDKCERKTLVTNKGMAELIETLIQYHAIGPVMVYIEAGWLNVKSNFRQTRSKTLGESIARKVGENHGVGKIIASVCEYYKIPYELIRPSQHTMSKLKAPEFKKITGYFETTNQDGRDALMLIFGR